MTEKQISTPEEIFKPIPGFPGYDISNYGRVRSYWQGAGRRGGWVLREHPQRTIKPHPNHNGYLQVTLKQNGRPITRRVHQLVLLTFIGPCPLGQQGMHLDGTRINNFIENLAYGTGSENCLAKNNHGTMPDFKGMGAPNSKLSDEQVIKIRSLSSQGVSQINIAKMYGICQQTISHIVNRKTWNHLL